jgi:predicted transcriptional regulator
VLTYLKQHDSITTTEAMQLLNLGKSRTAEILAMMSANGVIIKKGIGRATCYCRAMI